MSLSNPWKQTIVQVTTDGEDVRLFHIDCPSAQNEEKSVILLIHGFPETSYQFRHVLRPLSEAGYRVIVPDTTGHSNSSHPPHRYTKSLLADDLNHLLQNYLKLTKSIYVVGHDIGGMIAHSFAAHTPHSPKLSSGEIVRFQALLFTRKRKARGYCFILAFKLSSTLQFSSSLARRSSISNISITGLDTMQMAFPLRRSIIIR